MREVVLAGEVRSDCEGGGPVRDRVIENAEGSVDAPVGGQQVAPDPGTCSDCRLCPAEQRQCPGRAIPAEPGRGVAERAIAPLLRQQPRTATPAGLSVRRDPLQSLGSGQRHDGALTTFIPCCAAQTAVASAPERACEYGESDAVPERQESDVFHRAEDRTAAPCARPAGRDRSLSLPFGSRPWVVVDARRGRIGACRRRILRRMNSATAVVDSPPAVVRVERPGSEAAAETLRVG